MAEWDTWVNKPCVAVVNRRTVSRKKKHEETYTLYRIEPIQPGEGGKGPDAPPAPPDAPGP